MDNTGKLIGYGIGAVIGLYILMKVLPYLLAFLALIGAWHLYEQYTRNKR